MDFEMHVSNFKRDTRHLKLAEMGAYMSLVVHWFGHGELPTDDKSLRRIAGLGPKAWAKLKPKLVDFFDRDWNLKHRVFRLMAEDR